MLFLMKSEIHIKPYSENNFVTIPGRMTKIFRKFIPWQMYRFVVLNLKIMKIIIGGHS